MEKKRWFCSTSLPQLAKMASLVVLFLLAPLVPPSLRPPYLYLLFNALVFVLSVESGFLAAISGPRDDRHARPLPAPSDQVVGAATTTTDSHLVSGSSAVVVTDQASRLTPTNAPALEAMQELCVVAGGAAAKKKKTATAPKKKMMKRCPSRASIFFIGGAGDGGGGDHAVVDATTAAGHHHHGEADQEAGWKVVDGGEQQMSRQELFTKAEAFIGNFYKQLKMQREKSWKELQDLVYYHHHYKTKAL